ncbi:hypothetical protein COCNU_scaffold003431G000010 [Cocos nucifera]|nr:hypothetical protein [Cocos nucifera]
MWFKAVRGKAPALCSIFCDPILCYAMLCYQIDKNYLDGWWEIGYGLLHLGI